MSYDPFAAPLPPSHENVKSGNSTTVVIVAAVVAILTILALGVGVAWWILSRDSDEVAVAAQSLPTAEPVEEKAPGPTAEPGETAEPAESAAPTPFEPDPDALSHAESLGFTPVAYQMDIEAIREHYMEAASSGTLYEELIPATEEGADYVYAFMLAVTDYKAAGMFGGTFDGATRDEFANLELQFLTLADLDLDVHITQSDGTVFEHDGTAPKPPASE